MLGVEVVAIGNTRAPTYTHASTNGFQLGFSGCCRHGSDGGSLGGTYRGLGILRTLIIDRVAGGSPNY